MKKLIGFIAFLILGEIWLWKPISKMDHWQNLNQADSSLAITPQILILRRNFEDILDRNGVSTIPLGSRSQSRIVLCEESNGTVEYRSDCYGFRNPDDAWDKSIDVAIVGDSFAQGACVPDGQDIASHVRKEMGNVLNLGSLGNGALANLAVTSEYLRDTPPKRLLWFYVANDMMTDAPIEDQTPLLSAYRDSGFTQALKFRQKELDDLITGFLIDEVKAEANRTVWPEWLKLTNTQNLLTRAYVHVMRVDPWRQGQDMDYAHPESIDYEAFAHTLSLAKARLPSTQIQLVIIPDAGMFSEQHRSAASAHVQKIKDHMQRLRIPTIDAREAFQRNPDVLKNYALKSDGSYGHFTPEGYRLVSNYLLSVLKDKGEHLTRK